MCCEGSRKGSHCTVFTIPTPHPMPNTLIIQSQQRHQTYTTEIGKHCSYFSFLEEEVIQSWPPSQRKLLPASLSQSPFRGLVAPYGLKCGHHMTGKRQASLLPGRPRGETGSLTTVFYVPRNEKQKSLWPQKAVT